MRPMIKLTQLFDWETEPVDERPSEFMPSRLSEFSAFGELGSRGREATSPRAVDRSGMAFQRSAPSIHDTTLSSLVPRWMESLAPEVRPRFLCKRFPRIANRLALCWADTPLTVRLIDDLLSDKRGTRLGFPAEATTELSSLRQAASSRLGHVKP